MQLKPTRPFAGPMGKFLAARGTLRDRGRVCSVGNIQAALALVSVNAPSAFPPVVADGCTTRAPTLPLGAARSLGRLLWHVEAPFFMAAAVVESHFGPSLATCRRYPSN